MLTALLKSSLGPTTQATGKDSEVGRAEREGRERAGLTGDEERGMCAWD